MKLLFLGTSESGSGGKTTLDGRIRVDEALRGFLGFHALFCLCILGELLDLEGL
jgi:hypothetical protein